MALIAGNTRTGVGNPCAEAMQRVALGRGETTDIPDHCEAIATELIDHRSRRLGSIVDYKDRGRLSSHHQVPNLGSVDRFPDVYAVSAAAAARARTEARLIDNGG